MIIWLASYPKSGNTLLRSMISSYFFSKDGIFNFELIKNIKQFPEVKLFENCGVNIKNNDEMIKNYVNVQESFNKKNSIQFLKTHSYLFNFYNKYPFTNSKISLGVIYVVRDPRNVVTSLATFLNETINKSLDYMINSQTMGYNSNDTTMVYTGNWASNYKSWKSFDEINRYLLIKYEDFISKREETFIKILQFIYKLNNTSFIIDKKKFDNVIKTTEFDYLKNLELQKGFNEARIDKKTGKKINFFQLGAKRNWNNVLDKDIKDKIEITFKADMKELGYL